MRVGTTFGRLPSGRSGAAPIALLFIGLSAIGCIADPTSNSDTSHDSEQLESLPYLAWVPARDQLEQAGVISHDPKRSFPGLNLYSPRHLPKAILLDLDGKTIHSWSAPPRSDTWQVVELLAQGELLALVSDRRLLKVDRKSRVIWSLNQPFHHEISIAPDGRIFSLLREERSLTRGGRTVSILDDLIAVVSPTGELQQTISLFELFGNRVSRRRWQRILDWWEDPENVAKVEARRAANRVPLPHGSPVDLLHTNAAQVIPRDLTGLCRRGSVLISIRELNLVAIVDVDERQVVWTWGPGVLRAQHHPTLLDNDHILIFDNKGPGRESSRIVEIDPWRREIVWSYQAEPPQQFFSALRGASQRLPNGNTLITESDRGRVFEVTAEGDVVWDYYVPYLKRKKNSRAAVYRMIRLPLRPEDLPWADGVTDRAGP